MFVPIPTQNFKIYLKYSVRGKDYPWHDVFNETLAKHQSNRFAGNEAILLAYSNALRFYASSVGETSKFEKDDGANLYFMILKKIIINRIVTEQKANPVKTEIIIGIEDEITKKPHYHFYKVNN